MVLDSFILPNEMAVGGIKPIFRHQIWRHWLSSGAKKLDPHVRRDVVFKKFLSESSEGKKETWRPQKPEDLPPNLFFLKFQISGVYLKVLNFDSFGGCWSKHNVRHFQLIFQLCRKQILTLIISDLFIPCIWACSTPRWKPIHSFVASGVKVHEIVLGLRDPSAGCGTLLPFFVHTSENPWEWSTFGWPSQDFGSTLRPDDPHPSHQKCTWSAHRSPPQHGCSRTAYGVFTC
jgi:hypothetical protein